VADSIPSVKFGKISLNLADSSSFFNFSSNKSILLILHHETTLEKWHLNSPSGYLLKAIDISFHFLLDGHKPSEANKRTNIYYVPMHWK